jgi:hypothetical protein
MNDAELREKYGENVIINKVTPAEFDAMREREEKRLAEQEKREAEEAITMGELLVSNSFFRESLESVVIVMDDENSNFSRECKGMLAEILTETPNLPQVVAYKYGVTDREALFLLSGLYAGWQLGMNDFVVKA